MKQPNLFGEQQKRRKPVMLTGRSRKYLEHQGFLVALVERSVDVPKVKGQPFGERFRQKFDAFGIADLIAVMPGISGTLYIQVTDFHNAAAHREKMLSASATPILLMSNRVELHLWKSCKRKGQLKTWTLRIEKFQLFRGGAEIGEIREHRSYDNGQEIDPDF